MYVELLQYTSSANLIVNELPKVIQQQFDNAKLIVIAGLLGMFMNDPQIEIEEAEFMIDEIMTSIRRQSSQNNLLFIVSLNKDSSDDDDNNNNTHRHANYNKRIVKRFSKCIQMSRDNQFNNDDNLIIELSESSDRGHHHRSRSHHHHHNSNNKFLIKEDDLRKIISS